MKKVFYIMGFIAFAAIALCLWVRLAPSDPAIWHVAITDQTPATSGLCIDQIRTQPNGARATCLLEGDPATVLAKLDSIALATPRTTLLAATDGMTTWVTRSKLMGFPDYTTAQVRADPQGTRLDIYARQRFGSSDLGVNAARLVAWLTGL
ncbi:MAG: DUF1499 domain-containing protein [Pseudorhodobacter sp.]|nr:DUF1499 domain-containing protein [Pseudorhodobacter sp.]